MHALQAVQRVGASPGDLIARVESWASISDVTYNASKVRWRRFGRGAPLILLHGGHGSWLHWLLNIQQMARHHSVWVPDMPGFNVHEQSCRRARFRSRAISRAGGLRELLDRIDRPVLMLWGEHDVTAHPAQVAEALRQDRIEREWCLLPAAGHWVQYERATEVNRLLLSWFGVP